MNAPISDYHLSKKEVQNLIKLELLQLSYQNQLLLMFKFYHEKSNSEIADEMNQEVQLVPKLLEKALEQLKNNLDKSGVILPFILIKESLSNKTMCVVIPENLLPEVHQIFQNIFHTTIFSKLIYFKGNFMKALFTIFCVMTLCNLFFLKGLSAQEKLNSENINKNIVKKSSIDSNTDDEIPISSEVEKIIEKALAFLSVSQNIDGSWSDNGYGKNVGVNSLIILAFMSMGNLPGEGKYGDVVAKGVDWVMAQSKDSGLIQNIDNGGGNAMYGHGLSTLMLSEVWGQTRRKDIGEKLRKAVDLIVRVQGPKGSWGYFSIPIDGDTSVSVMQIFALKSASDAGMYVPKITMDKSIAVIKSRFDEKSNMFGYGGPDNNIDSGNVGAHTAGTCILQICGEKDPKYTIKAMEKTIEILEKHKNSISYFNYFTYYGSVSTYYAGPKHYKKWCETMIPLLSKSQIENGEIRDKCKTGWAVLSLSLPYRYIPVYQHEEK